MRPNESELGGCDELLDSNAGLAKHTRQSTDLQLSMHRDYATTTVRMTQHDVTPALTDLLKPQFAESPDRLSS